jgi:RHS repeat-associated protein
VARETRGAHGVDYVRGLQLIRQADSGGVQIYPLHGHLATSLGAVDAHGNIIEQVEADAFGVLQHGALKQAHLYSGEYVDADTQLVYLRARWYDPRIGRFVSADPFEGRQQDPRSLNRYAYAHSDPVHNLDPSGLFSSKEITKTTEILTASAGRTAAFAVARTGTMTILKKVAAGLAAGGAAYAFYQMNKPEKDRALPVIVFGRDVLKATEHYADALAANPRHTALARKFPPHPAGWKNSKPECLNQTGGTTGLDCDEFPFASTEQGGVSNYPGVSLRPVLSGHNQLAGSKLGAFYGVCDVSKSASSDDKWFAVVADPSAAITTFKCDWRKSQ